MGIDNSGYFVVGNEFDEIDFSYFPKFDQIGENDDISDFYFYEGGDLLKLKLDWSLMEPSGYQPSDIFGYCLQSPSYGVSDYNFADFVNDLNAIQEAWEKWTGKSPKIFVLNVQS